MTTCERSMAPLSEDERRLAESVASLRERTGIGLDEASRLFHVGGGKLGWILWRWKKEKEDVDEQA